MTEISWNPSYSVGVAELDEHHQHLAHLINQLAACVAHDNRTEKVVDILTALVAYAKYHFDQEERIMAEQEYPLLAPHRGEHLQFCEVIAETCYGASLGVIGANELFEYLSRWWSHHILHEDMKYKPYVTAKDASRHCA